MSDKEEYKCILCDSKLKSKEELQEHFRKHANKEIDTRGRTVKDNKNVVTNCDVCGKSFYSITATIRHKFKVHSRSQTKFYCPHCGMQFPLQTLKDNHQASHDLEERHMNKANYAKCETCNVLFYNKKALDYHHRSIHRRMVHMFQPIPTPPPSNKIKVNSMNDALSVYYCHLCGKEYVIKFNLQQHLERAHSKKDRETMPGDLIKCTVCSALFYNKKAYDFHNSYHRPDDLYVTSEQQRMQIVTKVDQDFDVRRVEGIANKYVFKTNISKRPIKHWSKKQKIQTLNKPVKEEYSSSDSDINKSVKEEYSSSDSDINKPVKEDNPSTGNKINKPVKRKYLSSDNDIKKPVKEKYLSSVNSVKKPMKEKYQSSDNDITGAKDTSDSESDLPLKQRLSS